MEHHGDEPLIRATAGPGDEVLYAWRSFEAYPMLIRAAGATPVEAALTDDLRHDLAAMLSAITPATRLVIVCNPNNPTGTTVDAAQIEEFVRQVPEHVVVLLDEAYRHFDAPDSAAGMDIFHRYPNVVVAHTFSKAYGLAGMRIGYAVASAEVAAAMRKVGIPFGVTSLAQSAAEASLRAEDELAERVAALVAERERVVASLVSDGWNLPESRTNFLWLSLGDDTEAAAEVFESHGLLVRAFAGEGLRATIAEREANDRILQVAAALVERSLTGNARR